MCRLLIFKLEMRICLYSRHYNVTLLQWKPTWLCMCAVKAMAQDDFCWKRSGHADQLTFESILVISNSSWKGSHAETKTPECVGHLMTRDTLLVLTVFYVSGLHYLTHSITVLGAGFSILLFFSIVGGSLHKLASGRCFWKLADMMRH